jgi:hypothetical protein
MKPHAIELGFGSLLSQFYCTHPALLSQISVTAVSEEQCVACMIHAELTEQQPFKNSSM